MFEYLRPSAEPPAAGAPIALRRRRAVRAAHALAARTLRIDRTAKLFIGGKQARPDGGYSRAVLGAGRRRSSGEVGDGNRKDIRNAVEAAHAAETAGPTRTAHLRAQILYYLAENLAARARRVRGRASRA